MTAQEVLEAVASLPMEDWMKIQHGIAEMYTLELSLVEAKEIQAAPAEAEDQFSRGEGMETAELRRQLGL